MSDELEQRKVEALESIAVTLTQLLQAVTTTGPADEEQQGVVPASNPGLPRTMDDSPIASA